MNGRSWNLKRAAVCLGLTALLGLAALIGSERAQAAVTCGGLKATIVGTNGANVLVGTSGADVIVARGGNDTIKGKGGGDLICAGGGNDYVDGGPAHDVVRGEVGHDTCVTSPGGGADKFVSCEDRTAFDLQIDDGLDWGFVEDAAENEPQAGDSVVTTLRMGVGGVGHAGYKRTMVAPQGLLSGPTTVLSFGSLDDGIAPVDLPFTMPFFGVPYDQISVSTNGWASFGGPAWDYMGDAQPEDYRGLPFAVGNFYRGLMPFWVDQDLQDGGTGGGSVSVVSGADFVAIQWNSGECCTGQPPHRVFQAVLYADGRIRYDYVSSTAPDTNPNPAVIGLSAGTGTQDLDIVRRNPLTHLRSDVTLPSATVPVRSTGGFAIPGMIQVGSSQVTCTGRTTTSFTGCTGGSGTLLAADLIRVFQFVDLPTKSVLYTPFASPVPSAPAGKVTFTLPAGSSLVDAPGCTVAKAPTTFRNGLLRCATPSLGHGDTFEANVTWTVPPLMGNNQASPPNVETTSTYMPSGAPPSLEYEEALFAGYTRTSFMTPELDYTGPAPAHVADDLTFQAKPVPRASDALAFPAMEIRIPAHMKLDTTFPNCGPKPTGFSGGTITCGLPNGVRGSWTADLTFHANLAGTYKPKVTFFAENAATAAKVFTLEVAP